MIIRFEEDFETEMDRDWKWVHEEPGAWKVEEGALHLRALPGTLWGDANNAHNFLLRGVDFSQDGFAIQVTISNQPQLVGEQAGLIWYHDDDNYVKLVKENLEGVEWIVLAREENGQPELIDKTRISMLSAELRLALLDGGIQGHFRKSPEDEWQKVGECALLNSANLRVGLFTHGGPAESERWVRLSQFKMLLLDR